MFVNPTSLYQLAKAIHEDLLKDADELRLLRQLRRHNHPSMAEPNSPAPEETAVQRKVS
jgi:hypothetical protein